MTAVCHEPGNGGKPRCVRDSDFDRINERVDASDERAGELVREVSLARSEAQAAHSIGRKVLDEVLQMRGDLAKTEQKRDEEIRRLDRRVERIEDDSTLSASSAVTYSHEALAKKYEVLKSDIRQLTEDKRIAEKAKEIAAEQKRQAEEDARVEAARAASVEAELTIAKARARKIEITAWATGAVVVIGAIAAAIAQLVGG